MDDLEFRRAIYADPDNPDADTQAAMQDSASRQQAWQDAKKLNFRLKSALDAELPEGIKARLMLKQSMLQHRQRQQRTWYAMAASIALVAVVSFAWLRPVDVDLGAHALSHVIAEGRAPFLIDEQVNLSQVNAKLASFSGQFNGDIGKVYYANFCSFEQVKSLHMVIDTPDGRVSVFIVPHSDKQTLPFQFADASLQGVARDMGVVSLLVVGEKNQAIKPTLKKLADHLQFSA